MSGQPRRTRVSRSTRRSQRPAAARPARADRDRRRHRVRSLPRSPAGPLRRPAANAAARTSRCGATARDLPLERGVEPWLLGAEDAARQHDFDVQLASCRSRRINALAIAASSVASRSTMSRATASPAAASSNTSGASLPHAGVSAPSSALVQRAGHVCRPAQTEERGHGPLERRARPAAVLRPNRGAECRHPEARATAPVPGDVADGREADLATVGRDRGGVDALAADQPDAPRPRRTGAQRPDRVVHHRDVLGTAPARRWPASAGGHPPGNRRRRATRRSAPATGAAAASPPRSRSHRPVARNCVHPLGERRAAGARSSVRAALRAACRRRARARRRPWSCRRRCPGPARAATLAPGSRASRKHGAGRDRRSAHRRSTNRSPARRSRSISPGSAAAVAGGQPWSSTMLPSPWRGNAIQDALLHLGAGAASQSWLLTCQPDVAVAQPRQHAGHPRSPVGDPERTAEPGPRLDAAGIVDRARRGRDIGRHARRASAAASARGSESGCRSGVRRRRSVAPARDRPRPSDPARTWSRGRRAAAERVEDPFRHRRRGRPVGMLHVEGERDAHRESSAPSGHVIARRR